MPAQERLRLNNQQRLFPGPNGSCQEQPIRFDKGGSFHVAAKNDELLPKDLLLARSVTAPNRREVVAGFVQFTKRWWSD